MPAPRTISADFLKTYGGGSAAHYGRRKPPYAKPMRGFGGTGVLEIVDDFDGDTFRAVYTVRFDEAVYVLPAFQKISRRGIATPNAELNVIQQRLQRAKEDYREWSANK